MLHHNKVPDVVINPHASKSVRPRLIPSPQLHDRIIAMKLAKAQSADIVAETGASESVIQNIWKKYRSENHGTACIPTGNRKMIDKHRYVKKAGELI